MAVMSVKDDEKITGISYYKDDEKITEISSFRTIRMALFCPATEKCPKERARMRNPAGSYPGPYLRLSPAVVSNARRGTIGFKERLSATMRSASGAARSISLYRAFAGV